MIKVYFTGNADLDRDLKALDAKLQRRLIIKAIREGLKPVLKDARNNAPRKTGRLRKSIKLRNIKRSRTRIGATISTSASDNAFSGKTFYAAFLEWGWRSGKRQQRTLQFNNAIRRAQRARRDTRRLRAVRDAGDTRKFNEPLLFMTRAAEDNRDIAQDIFLRTLSRLIETNLPKH